MELYATNNIDIRLHNKCLHYLNLCPVRQFIGKLALKLFCLWCKATVYPQYWIIHYYVHITNDLYWLYTSWVCLSCRDVHLFFLFYFFRSFQFLIRPISGMDKLIEQFVKLNTKLNRKLQPSHRYFYIFIYHLKWNLKFELCLFLYLLAGKECLNV